VLVFARNRTGTAPSRLDVGDIDATLVAAFLTDLDHLGNWSRGPGILAACARCLKRRTDLQLYQ
jgi:hypothetical protein